jgi:hypothetical protein
MENTQKQNYTIPSIFSRFLIGFGAGFIGTLVLGLMLFLSWKVVGETLSPSDVIKNEFGITITDNQTHPLFLSIVTLSVFLAVMAANIAYVFLSSIVEEKYIRRSTTLTQVFFGNLVFLLLMLPLYVISSSNFGPSGIAITAVLHAVFTAFFSFFSNRSFASVKIFHCKSLWNHYRYYIFRFLCEYARYKQCYNTHSFGIANPFRIHCVGKSIGRSFICLVD